MNAVRKRKNNASENAREQQPQQELRFGPMPRFSNQRVWSRGMVVIGVIIYVWYFSKSGKELILAAQKDTIENRGQSFECDKAYMQDVTRFAGCVPKRCGRFVTDKLVTASEAKTLLKMAKEGLAFGGSSGGASILDIHSGALSLEDKFVNIHTIGEAKKIFTAEYITTYKIVKEKIQHAIAHQFQIDASTLHLTYPTFFSRLTNAESKTKHDEYWHSHVDKETYESFHYTSLLYLTDHGVDFTGGRFIFQDMENEVPANITVEPRLGRVSMFTSGEENVHFVERVATGTRFAITISFTCDTHHSIDLPAIKN